MNEQELVKEAIKGDDHAYGLLVTRYERGLVRYCFTLTGDPDQAEDVAQEAFIKAYQHLNAYRPTHRFSTWLYRIAHNLAMSQLRKTEPLPIPEGLDLPYEDQTKEAVERQEREAALRRAVAALPQNYRACVHLHYWEHLSYEEVAAVLEVPVTTVKTWLFRARLKLKEELNEVVG